MTNTEYIRACVATNSKLQIPVTDANEDLVHATIGIGTESGELLDVTKRHLFYGKKVVDITNLKEEIGDLLWYVSMLIEWAGLSYEECMEANIEKLKARYPTGKWSQDKAFNRDLSNERKTLEK